MPQSEEYKKAYYQANREKAKKYAKQYRMNNPDYYKNYYKDHIEYYQNYYDENAERVKKYQREYIAKKRGQLKLPKEQVKKNNKLKIPKQDSQVKSMCQSKTDKIEKQLAEMATKAAAFKLSMYNSSENSHLEDL